MKMVFVSWFSVYPFAFATAFSFLALIVGFFWRDLTPNELFRVLAGTLIGASLTYFSSLRYKKKYRTCPTCDKEMLVITDWLCPYCNNCQGINRLISFSCKHCGRKLKEFYCEHCNEKIIIDRWP